MSLVMLLACADSSLNSLDGKGGDTADAGGTEDTAFDSGDIDDPANPAWYTFEATVALVGGEPDPATTAIAIDVVDEDLVRINCTVDLDVTALVSAEAPSPDVSSWWSLPLTPLEEPCTTLPGTVELGLGTLDPEVRARLGAVDLDVAADDLWGVWLRVDGGELWALGYATGTLGGAAVQPPPDDTYTLVSLFLIPLD